MLNNKYIYRYDDDGQIEIIYRLIVLKSFCKTRISSKFDFGFLFFIVYEL